MGTMATPWKHPTSGYYYIRRAVPKDLQESLGSIYKKTLSTKDPHEAKSLFAAAWVQSEERFALARAQLEGGTLLSAKDIQQLAVRWFSQELSKMEASGDFTPFLYIDSEEGASSIRYLLEESSTIAGIVSPFINATLEAHKLPPVAASAPLYKQLVEAFTTHLLKLSDCSGLLTPDTFLGEDDRHTEVFDEQTTTYFHPHLQARGCQPGARPRLQLPRGCQIP